MKRLFESLAVALSLAFASPARAQTDPSAQAEVAAQLVLDADLIDGVEREALRAAIAAELGVEVALAAPGVSGKGTMRVRLEGPGKVTVSFRAEGGKEIGRSLELPKKQELAVETITLILGNLVRNEAGELLESMKPKPKPAVPPAPEVASYPPQLMTPPPFDPCTPASTWIGLDAVPGVGWHRAETRALSFGLLGTWSRGVRGAELGPVAAITHGHVCGLQLGGAVAVVTGDVRGLQIGGAAAVTLGTVRGVMLSAVNVAGSVYGAQVGAVNIATGDVHGLQLGLVNIARDADAPIGLVSIMTHGRTHLDVVGNETGLGLVELVHGGRRVHNLYGLGTRLGPRGSRVAVMLGLGGRVYGSQGLTLDVDATVTQLHRTNDFEKSTLISQLRALVGVRVFDDLAILAGPTWSVMWTNDPEESPQASVGVKRFADDVHGWPGVTVGLRGF